MGKKHHVYQTTHPFDAHPFEAFFHGTWQPVERLTVKDGAITTYIVDDEFVIEEIILMSNIRIRSRKATVSDCTCFIRPGIDICVLSASQNAENSGEDENPEPVWVDARINSIERKPHESKCECQFYISLYVNQGSFTTKRALSKESNVVQIDQISILQKIEKSPCENEHYRWNFSEDCSSRQVIKLFMGKFASDLSWLLVASVQKQIVFDVRSIQNRIVYQIVYRDHDKFPLKCTKNSKAVNFKVENGNSISILVPFVEANTPEDVSPNSDMNEVENSSAYELTDLRRSKRRFVQPERYLGCDGFSESDIDVARLRLYRTFKEEYEEMPLALSVQDDHAFNSGKSYVYERKANFLDLDSYKAFKKIKSRDANSVVADQIEHENHLAIVPVPAEIGLVVQEEDPLHAEIRPTDSGTVGETMSKYVYTNSSPSLRKKKISQRDSMEYEGQFGGKDSHQKYDRKKDYFICLDTESPYNGITYRERPFQTGVYKEMINKCLHSIESAINREQPLIIDQWKEFQAGNLRDQGDGYEVPSMSNEEDCSEIDMLWKEMELSLASSYLLEDNEASEFDVPAETVAMLRNRGQACRHEYKLDEEIGICCELCGFVSTEIKDVSPSFLKFSGWTTTKERRSEEDSNISNNKVEDDTSLDLFKIAASSSMPLSEGTDNVWALIPELKMKLKFHQKRAFEFLWRNIAGSLEPALMEPSAKKRGGCVVSHAPGAGKTLLIIAFLVSYLKLFPGSRPLVLAPKTTLYTWYKEVIKWEIPIPVYQIHGARTYRCKVLRQKLNLSAGVNQDVMHVLDCLEKIQRWLARPSILLMGYTSFLTLTREDSKHTHRKYMSQVLRKCPGILILDEGHNPRSTKSRLRKGLMKVDTGLRILLSGTLFQNNFGEYFNTLCLARPSFVHEVLKELDPRFKMRKKGAKSRFSLENRARKFFIDNLSKKIDSSIPEERMKVLNLLKSLTGGFIDVYEGGNCDKLPGLQCYTLMMKPTTLQGEILVKLQNQRPMYRGFPLELELLITLGSIHPWLIRTTTCASQYFTAEELENLEQYKFDLKLGSKIRFVMSLVPRCLIRKEKVLIFCHNIAPINLFLEIFETFYGWKKGDDVLVLQGDLELFERGRVMDKFEEPGGSSKVLLASINACAEGISLTAASRVILLDSEWNPSKSKQAIARAFRPGQAKMVYVYQLLATGTLEEEKHSRTTWKEWVSSMIFSEELVEDPSHWQAEKIEDDVLREIVEEERGALFNRIMKNEKASNGVVRGKE